MSDRPQDGTSSLRIVFVGAGISYAAQLFSTAVNFTHTVGLARFYKRAGLGLYSTAFPLSRYLTIIASLGLNNAIVRFLPIHRRRHEPAQIAAVMGWSLRVTALVSGLLGVLLWLAAEVISAGIFGEPGLAPLLRVFAFVVPLAALAAVVTSGAQAFDRQDYRALPTSIVQPALQLGLVLLFGWMGYAVTSAVHARAWSMLAALAVGAVLVRRLTPLGLRGSLPAGRAGELLRFATPACAAGLLMSVCSSLPLLMTTALVGSEETGLYAAAFRVTFIGILMLRSFTWSFDPVVARLLDAGDTVELRRVLRAVTKVLLAANLPFAALFILLAEPLASLFGPDFLPAVTPMRILAVDSVILALAYLGDHLVLFSGRSSLTLVNNLGLLVATFVLDLFLIPAMGARGAAVGSLAAHTALLIVCLIELGLLLRLMPFGLQQLKIVIAAGAAMVAGLGVQHFLLASPLGLTGSLAVLGVYAGVYLPLLFLSLTDRDRARIRRALGRLRQR